MPAPMLQTRHPGNAEPWPLASAIDLGTLPAAVTCARHYTVYMLSEWNHLSPLASDAQVVVSELVTNAVVHGAGPVTLCLRATSEKLLVEVWDASPKPPMPHPHDVNAEGGFGLEVVCLIAGD